MAVKSYRRAGFDLDEKELQANLTAFEAKFSKYVTELFDFAAVKAQEQMKLKAPWTDRTTAARNSLHAKATHKGRMGSKRHELIVAHGVPYGIWLEVANSGKFQILMPTVTSVGREIMKTLQGAFAHLDTKPNPAPKLTVPKAPRKGTSQGTRQKASTAKKTTKAVAKKTSRTPATKRTRKL